MVLCYLYLQRKMGSNALRPVRSSKARSSHRLTGGQHIQDKYCYSLSRCITISRQNTTFQVAILPMGTGTHGYKYPRVPYPGHTLPAKSWAGHGYSHATTGIRKPYPCWPDMCIIEFSIHQPSPSRYHRKALTRQQHHRPLFSSSRSSPFSVSSTVMWRHIVGCELLIYTMGKGTHWVWARVKYYTRGYGYG